VHTNDEVEDLAEREQQGRYTEKYHGTGLAEDSEHEDGFQDEEPHNQEEGEEEVQNVEGEIPEGGKIRDLESTRVVETRVDGNVADPDKDGECGDDAQAER
jgi:hypothetical protein